METKADYNVKEVLVDAQRDVIMYHCPYCMKRKSHYRVTADNYEYLMCRTCGRVLTFRLVDDTTNDNHGM